jgi:RNA polymerase sigma-70 factor (ECF subfamily)
MRNPPHPKEPKTPDQTLLVLLAQTGDRAALEQLLRDTHAPMRRYITRLVGADLADDILQETSLNLGEPPDDAFLALLDRVSPASRAVLLLHYQHDLSLEESAAILEIPIGTVKSRLHYGVTTLRKHLTSERNPT